MTMTQVANLPIERYPEALGAIGSMRTGYSAMLSPDTPELTASSCLSSTDSDHSLYSPLSPVALTPLSARKPAFQLGKAASPFHLSFYGFTHRGDQHHDDDYDYDASRPMSVPPNSPLDAVAQDSNLSGLRRQHKPLPFLTTFMASALVMKLFAEDDARDELRDGVRPHPPTTKSQFIQRDEESTSDLEPVFISKQERRRRVESLKLQSPLEPEMPIIAIDTPYEDSAKIASGVSPLSPDNQWQDQRGPIRLTGPSPITRGRRTQRLLIASPVKSHRRRWTIGGDEDDILSPLSSNPENSPLEPPAVPNNTPASGISLRRAMPSLSDPIHSIEWQSVRQIIVASKELVRSERHYLDALRAFRPEGVLQTQAIQCLQRNSESLLAKLEQDASADGVARAFVGEADVMEVAFATWGSALGAASSVDVMRHAAGYVSHFRDMLHGTPTISPSWTNVSRAFDCAMRISQKCAAVPESL
ncbi:hypothetical protein HGRIS_002330 [Hohenbuehelia grisea]|uniref:DH domain-containing protein n=1 Tax=Hohenbuehelia grisea TaxID=104357 RepID=A0ABR3JM26_9AGAR